MKALMKLILTIVVVVVGWNIYLAVENGNSGPGGQSAPGGNAPGSVPPPGTYEPDWGRYDGEGPTMTATPKTPTPFGYDELAEFKSQRYRVQPQPLDGFDQSNDTAKQLKIQWHEAFKSLINAMDAQRSYDDVKTLYDQTFEAKQRYDAFRSRQRLR